MAKKIESIIPGDSEFKCYVCNRWANSYNRLEVHHAIQGTANHKKSDEYGLIVHLCWECHRGTIGVHGRDGQAVNMRIHRDGQRAWEERMRHIYDWNADYARKKFIEEFGKSYL